MPRSLRASRSRFVLLTGALFLAACADTPSSEASRISSASISEPAPSTVPVAEATKPTFSQWQQSFREKALAQGIRPEVLDQAFQGLSLDPKVLQSDQAQPEFTRPVWEYLQGAVSPSRVKKGQALLQEHRHTLDEIERRYGVDRHILVAIWGMESNFGQFMGSQSVIRSLATLAYEGRRPQFAEDQLLAALQILQSGDTTAGAMLGSWAGAMGQTQFIPTTYLSYAVDFNGDGRRDIWGSSADALASAANYLKISGWKDGRSWGTQVTLPQGFDYALADTSIRRSYSDWQALGVKAIGTPPSPDAQGYLLLPAGYRGPAFLLFGNFAAILRYNNSSAYALGVSLLAESFKGGGKVHGKWPVDDRPLSRSERIALQEALTAKGFNPGPADGIIGANSRRAIRAVQQQLGLPADGYPTAALLQRLQ